MPAIGVKTLAQLRAEIKQEARVKGADNLDTFINDLIHELLLEEVIKHRYHELLVLNASIPAVAESGEYALPDNAMFVRLIRYMYSHGGSRVLQPKTDYITPSITGTPRYYEQNGTSLSIFPYSSVQAEDSLTVDYYKAPDVMADDDVFPIVRLLTPIKQKAVVRVHIFNQEMQSAAALAAGPESVITRSQSGSN